MKILLSLTDIYNGNEVDAIETLIYIPHTLSITMIEGNTENVCMIQCDDEASID